MIIDSRTTVRTTTVRNSRVDLAFNVIFEHLNVLNHSQLWTSDNCPTICPNLSADNIPPYVIGGCPQLSVRSKKKDIRKPDKIDPGNRGKCDGRRRQR
jgi:hypothetical protein